MNKKNNRFIVLILLVAILLTSFLIKIPTFSEPFSRDEGLYAYIAEGMASGHKLYSEVFEFKPPGLFFIYALVQKTVGSSEVALRIFTALYSLLTNLAIFGIASLLFGATAGLFSAFLFAIYSGGFILEGNIANAEIFMILPLALACWSLLLYLAKRKRYLLFISGLLCSIGLLFKVVAIFHILLIPVFLSILFLARQKQYGLKSFLVDICTFLGGVFLILSLACLYFYKIGTFRDFLFATWFFGFTYLKITYDFNYLFRLVANSAQVFNEGFLLWSAAVSAIFYLLSRKRNTQESFLICWVIFASLGICISGRFYEHYYIQLIPVISILGGYALSEVYHSVIKEKARLLLRYFIVVSFFGAIALFFMNSYDYYQNYLQYLAKKVSKESYQSFFKARNVPFNYQLADYVVKNTIASDFVLVWGQEPVINFLSKRRSPTRYVMDFHADNIKGGLQEVMNDVVARKPKIIIVFDKLFPELQDFINFNYRLDLESGGINVFILKERN